MKIVVCDDDALVYEQMKNIIASYSIVKNENLELTFYQTVEELLHAKHKYDILFLDIRFNNCDIGIDVAKKLRKAGNTSLIILLTSLHSKAIEGYEIGAYRYIVKPIRFLYKGIIIKHNKTEPTYTKTSLFSRKRRRFFMARFWKGVVLTSYLKRKGEFF